MSAAKLETYYAFRRPVHLPTSGNSSVPLELARLLMLRRQVPELGIEYHPEDKAIIDMPTSTWTDEPLSEMRTISAHWSMWDGRAERYEHSTAEMLYRCEELCLSAADPFPIRGGMFPTPLSVDELMFAVSKHLGFAQHLELGGAVVWCVERRDAIKPLYATSDHFGAWSVDGVQYLTIQDAWQALTGLDGAVKIQDIVL